MDATLRAIETTGSIDEYGQLRVDGPLPVADSGRVKVIVLLTGATDPEEPAWSKAASSNPAFDFLNDEEEDVYTPEDGRPFVDQG